MKSLSTCKVDTSYSDRMYSDRLLSPENVICPTHTGLDTVGRPVCMDSLHTKTAGCHSPLDRVHVENVHRPRYFEYVGLNAQGIEGTPSDVYGANVPPNVHQSEQAAANYRAMNNNLPHFGNDFRATNRHTCAPNYGYYH